MAPDEPAPVLPWRDPLLWAAVAVGLVLRAAPMLLWGWSGDDCTRDECIYKIVARPILAGDGLGLAPAYWLPAPGYPYLLAACKVLFGSFESVKWVQWALTVPTLFLCHALGARVAGLRAGRALAWGFAVHPTFVFFVGTMWTETTYTLLLLLLVWGVGWARDGASNRAVVPGLALAGAVLSRGIATYLLPLVLLATVWPAPGDTWSDGWRRWSHHARVLATTAVLTVLPYSLAASVAYGGLVVSDRTLGHVAWLGNDDFAPVTFDYGIGQLTGDVYAHTRRSGTTDCPDKLDVLSYDACKVAHARQWVWRHPGTFLARIPVRLAQLFNPHSFLTRHVRWHDWPTLPWAAEEAIVAWQAAWTAGVVWLGTLAMWARARGSAGVLTVGVVVYTVAVIAALYGLTRFRLPLEPLWMLWVAVAVADPEGVRAGLRTPWRLAGALVTLPVVVALTARYAWTGWP